MVRRSPLRFAGLPHDASQNLGSFQPSYGGARGRVSARVASPALGRQPPYGALISRWFPCARGAAFGRTHRCSSGSDRHASPWRNRVSPQLIPFSVVRALCPSPQFQAAQFIGESTSIMLVETKSTSTRPPTGRLRLRFPQIFQVSRLKPR